MIVIVLWFGGLLVLKYETLSGPTFIYYMVILYSIINPLKEFAKAGYSIPKGLASMERVDKILRAENTIREKPDPTHIDSFDHQIEFRHVSFRYGEQWVLKDINLVIPKGKTIALVGQSGSGKSTMVDLIPRYYDVQKGEVLIDGINVKDLGLHDLRQLIGNVNQEAILFNDSFRNNITFGVDNATQEQVEEAARIANAHEFIMQSEAGYDTSIGDRGGRLSGGQRQRVSIARAILKNPPILILDEATSALDTESERLVDSKEQYIQPPDGQLLRPLHSLVAQPADCTGHLFRGPSGISVRELQLLQRPYLGLISLANLRRRMDVRPFGHRLQQHSVYRDDAFPTVAEGEQYI